MQRRKVSEKEKNSDTGKDNNPSPQNGNEKVEVNDIPKIRPLTLVLVCCFMTFLLVTFVILLAILASLLTTQTIFWGYEEGDFRRLPLVNSLLPPVLFL